MNYLKLLFLCFVLIDVQPVLAVMRAPVPGIEKQVPALITTFGKTGTVDKVDPQGRWIQISNKKYILNGTGTLNLEDLHQGLSVYYNVEKARNESIGRVTRIWVE